MTHMKKLGRVLIFQKPFFNRMVEKEDIRFCKLENSAEAEIRHLCKAINLRFGLCLVS